MRRTFFLLTFVFTVAAFGQSQQSDSPRGAHTKRPDGSRNPGGIVSVGSIPRPWLMTDDERIERRAAMSPLRGGAHAQSVDEERFAEKLDGLEHPEFFLPFELFDHLLNGLSTRALPRDNAHTLYDPKLKAL